MHIGVPRLHRLCNRVSLPLALLFFLAQAVPALCAQDKERDKHMKEGAGAYTKGISKECPAGDFTGQTNLASAPEFAKAKREFLDALALAQSFPAGDVRTADTLGRLADTYAEDRKFEEAEARGKQAMALLEEPLTPNNPDLGYASIGMALIHDSESRLEQAAPLWDRALAILKRTGNANPQVFPNLETRALNFDTAERAQTNQFLLDLRQSAVPAPQQDRATLYFFNTSGWKVFPEKLTLLDNDKKIAALNREQYVVLPIALGHHVLRPKDERPPRGSPKHEVDLDAKPGVTYYLAGGFSPGGHYFRWTFAEIPKYEADKLLAEMKPQAEK